MSGLGAAPPSWRDADLILGWEGPHRTLHRNLLGLQQRLPVAPPPLALDLVDIATAVYGADIAVTRGRNEDWVRSIELLVPVREPEFWRSRSADLSYLLYVLTRDGFRFEFVARELPAAQERVGIKPFAADCVCLVSGGVDSLAGALMLLKTGRSPLLVCHQSGNPTLQAAQTQVAQRLMAVAPEQSALAPVRLHTDGHAEGAPPPADREPSQRSRAFLFMSLALAAAGALGVPEAYVCENGILTIALPLSSARIGGMSTRSTHPKVIALMNRLAGHCGLLCSLTNPFVYLTKAEVVRDILRPAMAPFDLQRTVSCWAAGRASRQCGGCVACLVRRLAMLAAGLPDEAYEIDVLGHPDAHRGTDAHANLVDLLSLAAAYRTESDAALLTMSPELLDCATAGVSLPEALAMYRRFAAEVDTVVKAHFPAAARLMP